MSDRGLWLVIALAVLAFLVWLGSTGLLLYKGWDIKYEHFDNHPIRYR